MAAALKNALTTASTLRPTRTSSKIEVMLGVLSAKVEHQPAIPHRRRVPARGVHRAVLAERAMSGQHRAGVTPTSPRRGHRTRVLVYRPRWRHVGILARRAGRQSSFRGRHGGASGRSVAVRTPMKSSRRFSRSMRRVFAWNTCQRPSSCRLTRSAGGRRKTLRPNSRRVTVDLGLLRSSWAELSVPVADYYERCLPLMDRTLVLVDNLPSLTHGAPVKGASGPAGGGRRLCDGRRQWSSPSWPAVCATDTAASSVARLTRAGRRAMGWPGVDGRSGYTLRDRFTHHFGVWREGHDGTSSPLM